MQVTVENVSELGRKMTITVEDVNIKEAVQQRLASIRPKVKMAGFRPGKVPMKMVEKTHGMSARSEIIDELVQKSMREAFEKEKVNPASTPQVDSLKEEDSSLIYTLNYEIFPEVKTVELKGLELDKSVAEVTDEDVDNMLNTLREQRATWDPLKRAAKEEDGVTIDFVGRIDGEEFQGGKGQDVLVVIGNGSMLPEFEEQLVGVKAGQDTTVTLTFPDDYRAEHLRGKTAEFAVTVKQVAKQKLPKLDKSFAELCGVEGGLAALKKEVRTNMERELANTLKNLNKRQALDKLADNNQFALPEAAVEREAQHLMEQAKNNLRQQGVNVEGLPFELETFKGNATKRVKLSLLVSKIIADNDIKPDEDKVKSAIDAIAASYEDPEDVVNYYRNNQDKLSEIQMMVVEDSVVDWIFDNVKVTEKTSTFSEVMNAAR
ncbi:Cell division trigger factor [Methylophaga frappieri]|uniref:Trigger factor n=1 Tax=Methylophaga frappieri (strain ATCC BAA-2434 / DSM 25690 / JAM7) TaxID=754477 RepID=I1YLJ7_METFJ|nr:trigger factor [Methylophaga frappieri]AFJ03790.1 Cell division trigger factor [Methylophaga frappieri]